jgi:hypothetical protein
MKVAKPDYAYYNQFRVYTRKLFHATLFIAGIYEFVYISKLATKAKFANLKRYMPLVMDFYENNKIK